MDENSTSGMMDVFRPATGVPPPALEHAVELYKLTHDILSPKAKNKLCSYFQAKWLGVRTQHSATLFVDENYDRIKEALDDYDVIIRRWPEYAFPLENVAVADVVAPLKEKKFFGLKYIQKLTKPATLYLAPREVCAYYAGSSFSFLSVDSVAAVAVSMYLVTSVMLVAGMASSNLMVPILATGANTSSKSMPCSCM
nr:hypothetical protein [Tanacetum cinerariifolium]